MSTIEIPIPPPGYCYIVTNKGWSLVRIEEMALNPAWPEDEVRGDESSRAPTSGQREFVFAMHGRAVRVEDSLLSPVWRVLWHGMDEVRASVADVAAALERTGYLVQLAEPGDPSMPSYRDCEARLSAADPLLSKRSANDRADAIIKSRHLNGR